MTCSKHSWKNVHLWAITKLWISHTTWFDFLRSLDFKKKILTNDKQWVDCGLRFQVGYVTMNKAKMAKRVEPGLKQLYPKSFLKKPSTLTVISLSSVCFRLYYYVKLYGVISSGQLIKQTLLDMLLARRKEILCCILRLQQNFCWINR